MIKKLLTLLLLFLIGCDPGPLDYQLLIERDGVHYRKKTNEIYSGPVFNINGISEATLKEGKFDGPFKSYYKDGKLKEERTYKDGLVDGPFKSYRENGELKEEATFKNGEPDGVYKLYYKQFSENANLEYIKSRKSLLKEEQIYKDGILHGPWKSYVDFPGCQRFVDGKLKTFRLRSEKIYKDGEEISEKKYECGSKVKNTTLVSEKTYKNGQQDGPYTIWKGPNIIEEGTYVNGEHTGIVKRYKWGEPVEDVTLRNSIKDGPHIIYFEKGQYSVYDRGSYDFLTIKGGIIKKELLFKNGKPNGPWKTYYANGLLEKEETWKDGKLDGPYKTYYANGKLQSSYIYKNALIAHFVDKTHCLTTKQGLLR